MAQNGFPGRNLRTRTFVGVLPKVVLETCPCLIRGAQHWCFCSHSCASRCLCLLSLAPCQTQDVCFLVIKETPGSCLTLQVQTQVTGLPVIYSSVLLRNLRRRRLIGAGGWLHHNLWGSQRARTRSLRGIKRCLHSRIHYGIHWLYFLASPLDSYPAGSACFFQLRHWHPEMCCD